LAPLFTVNNAALDNSYNWINDMVRESMVIIIATTALLGLGCVQHSSTKLSDSESPASSGYVLVGGPGLMKIFTSPATGSSHFAMGTQELRSGSSIPMHRHEHADEAFFVHDGHGIGVVGETRKSLSKGDAAYIPRGVWHGFETDTESLNVVWFIAPPGLEEFFRETRVPPGTPLRNLTPEQMEKIGLKHGLEKKPE
jgi:quercetin dioxygenase-like cupin family protein